MGAETETDRRATKLANNTYRNIAAILFGLALFRYYLRLYRITSSGNANRVELNIKNKNITFSSGERSHSLGKQNRGKEIYVL
jgi:hypothetical protein